MFKEYLFIPLILMSCYSGYPLTSNGDSREDRMEYVKYRILPDSISRSYIKGNPHTGMDRRMIQSLFGMPDNITYSPIWKYPLINGKIGILEFDMTGKVISINEELLNNPRIENNRKVIYDQ